jgi:cytoskeletal protein RodZ
MTTSKTLLCLIAAGLAIALLAFIGLVLSPTWYGAQLISFMLVVAIIVGLVAMLVSLARQQPEPSTTSPQKLSQTNQLSTEPADVMNPHQDTHSAAPTVPLQEVLTDHDQVEASDQQMTKEPS